MNNIGGIKQCYGCGVCTIACPEKIISLQVNRDGFYEPSVDFPEQCINCGLCVKVCAYTAGSVRNDVGQAIEGYGVWSGDVNIRQKCSSGGAGFEIGKYLIREGYKACGVRFNPELNRAEHFVSTTEEGYIPSIGSKYIQSYTPDAFKQFNGKDRFLVTGTPCQIDSLRRYLSLMRWEDHYVLVDFFCHGTPSLNLWKQYTADIEKQTGKLISAFWRNKGNGWHDAFIIGVCGIKADYTSRKSEDDLFYRFFLGNYCLNDCCYDKCKYKMLASAADIRIGDLWGEKYRNDEQGVSAVVCLTERGRNVVAALKDTCLLTPESLTVVTEGQMKKSPEKPFIQPFIFRQLYAGKSLRKISETSLRIYRLGILPKRILRKMKSMFIWK